MSHLKDKEPDSSQDQSQPTGSNKFEIDDNRENATDSSAADEAVGWKSPAPDGGSKAWLTVLGVWCVAFCSFGWINSIGVFQGYYESVLLKDYSATAVSWIPSLQIFFMFFGGPVVGRIFDLSGPRYILLVGSFLHVFGLMMCSLSHSYYQILLSQGVCSAIGVAAIFQPAISCLPAWFDKKRGAAFGIAATGSSIGGIIFPIMVARLIPQVGFPWTMRICAFLILGLLIIGNLTVRARFPPNPKTMSRKDLHEPFTDIKFIFICVGVLFLTFGIFIPINYITVEALSKGVASSLAQYLIAILNAGSVIGRLGSGALSDKVGVYNIFIFVCLLSAIFILALWIPASGIGALIAFAAIFGCTSGAYVALATPIIAKISPLPQIGYRTGLLYLFSSIGGLTTNPIAGAILDKWNGSYTGMKIFSGVLLLVGTACICVTRLMATNGKANAIF
ncbi:hypothetical protein PFICI_14236 [Pestalotiopsis fici W106-1]|uniref:Major facilitator superfamily (MFS) profile domain-containing protein n=1 Tax=Pestalotiopsis fici (strain W106-1 / CGMCC3.15140) TaxID=1229662 RepID=W3WKB9_PESFW|nr:uncharacterized protein PFICI_14236 [Pestalotiopsis fici W106-1]ETS74370.1 hypothetical protein PFICI_14236 [Pestalotiopsis fici W106-1]